MLLEITNAIRETLVMIFISGAMSVIIGSILVVFGNNLKNENKINSIFSFAILTINNIPFLLLILFFIPVIKIFSEYNFSLLLMASLPLAVAGTSIFYKNISKLLKSMPKEIMQSAITMRASKWQFIYNFFLPEMHREVVKICCNLLIKLTMLSTMLGIFSGVGLGYLAMQYGYQDFNFTNLFLISCVLLLITNSLQYISKRITKQTYARNFIVD